ncbi:hypothetical protein [Psychrobacillus sp. OK032]|uniref:hypothetical protein n=1 Tax=Psychrobacillus sp. OK032 TaxID=1884358 RepID=UPI0008D6E107|nr:hypothetical protein [Psychrobacillus sp. OK032]SES25074.1 hypothetical protein SAMN05518872_106177 [Psychrobacillus sp. OK032]
MKKLLLFTTFVSAMLLAACGEEAVEPENTTSDVEVEQDVKTTEESKENAIEEGAFGKRSNPVPVGTTQPVDIVIYDNESNSFAGKADITITDVKRGQEVLDFVKGQNEFNETPPEGYEYIMLNVKATLKEAETEDYAWLADGWDFNFIGEDGSPYEMVSVVHEPAYHGEVYVGGTVEGLIINQVKVNDPIKVVYEDGNWDNVFFSTK